TNYTSKYADKTITISPATLSSTTSRNDSTYNGSANSASAVVSGPVVADNPISSPAATFAYYSGSSVLSGTPIGGAPTNAGTYTVRASFAGNTNYTSKYADKTITISPATQTIGFVQPADKFFGNHDITLSATGGGSGNAVTFVTTTASVCTSGGTNGTTITFTGVGTCTVTASQAGNGNYQAALDVSRSFAVKPDPTTITLDTKIS